MEVDAIASTYPIKDDFLRAAESQGIPVVDDLQDLKTGHGAEHWYVPIWFRRMTRRKLNNNRADLNSRLKWINRDVRPEVSFV